MNLVWKSSTFRSTSVWHECKARVQTQGTHKLCWHYGKYYLLILFLPDKGFSYGLYKSGSRICWAGNWHFFSIHSLILNLYPIRHAYGCFPHTSIFKLIFIYLIPLSLTVDSCIISCVWGLIPFFFSVIFIIFIRNKKRLTMCQEEEMRYKKNYFLCVCVACLLALTW